MVQSVSSPADMVNLALSRMGYKGDVGSLWDGSLAANKALDIYAQSRDQLLRDGEWHFAQREGLLTLLKEAPASYIPGITPWTSDYPPPPWAFEYAYPEDALKIRAVKRVPLFRAEMDPAPNEFQVKNDAAYAPPKKVILSNVPNALVVYTGRVTDSTTWDASFIEAFAATLARRLAPVLMSGEAAQAIAHDEQAQNSVASGVVE